MTTASGMGDTSCTVRHAGRIVVAAAADHATRLAEVLEAGGHQVLVGVATDATDATGRSPDLVVVDADGYSQAEGRFESPIVVVGWPGEECGSSSFPAALAVLENGVGLSTVLNALIGLAIQLRDMQQRCRELEQLAGGLRDGSAMVGRSPVMRRIHDALRRAADLDTTLLIEGAAGSGKSLAARLVHCKSRRSNLAATVHQCEALDSDAVARAIQQAGASTLILEGIDRMPAGSQAALVRHLKERPRPGQEPTRPRIIATTSAHLPELVARGAFREDLYYRLNVFPLRMPTLRERAEDIVPLAEYFLQACAQHVGTAAAGFTQAALQQMENLQWPGNVTQLETTVRRAHALAAGAAIERHHLVGPGPETVTPHRAEAPPPDDDEVTEDSIRPFEEEEQRMLARALRATRGNVRRAAQLLGIGRATLYRKIQQYRLRLH